VADRIWEIRNPDGASMGLEVARGRSGEHDVLLAHAMPERIDVGGEIGILTAWWNADDGSEKTWSIELHNRR
jgi:hypothetical protein